MKWRRYDTQNFEFLRFIPVLGFFGRSAYVEHVGVFGIKLTVFPVDAGNGIRYQKIEFFVRWPFIFLLQFYISRYKKDLKEHIDPTLPHERLFVLSVLLKKAKKGGQLFCEKFIFQTKRIALFEAGRYRHGVRTVEAGERIVLLVRMRYAHKYLWPPSI